ncbi:hypothetical protein CP10881SC42_0318 [Chlamydia avium]|uniref:Uncharacterized protein n=1 Tax=Chlamydia avium TaxID=1457141 RepID=A0ABN0MTX8_9CHLA|nr:hypothetical protein CP10743SC13_0229 [Chlamydia psittaci 10_743_SC13]EPP38918.1 hypothetical protein CP10881SC42_0318 [Chlamydia avium]
MACNVCFLFSSNLLIFFNAEATIQQDVVERQLRHKEK